MFGKSIIHGYNQIDRRFFRYEFGHVEFKRQVTALVIALPIEKIDDLNGFGLSDWILNLPNCFPLIQTMQ